MKEWLYYVFYRASKYYEDGWEKDGVFLRGSLVATGSIGSIVLSVIVFVMHYWFDKEINNEIIVGVVTVEVICSFFFTRKKYEQLSEKYKDEKNSKLKGWLVFIYAVGTIVLYGVSSIIGGYWVAVEI